MAKNKITSEPSRVIAELSVWHKPFGWFVFVVFGLGGLLFNPNLFDLLFGIVGYWSATKKQQVCWYPDSGKWSYREKNFFKWSEKYYEMTGKDALTLEYHETWRTGGHRSSSFILSFKPSVEGVEANSSSIENLRLQSFGYSRAISEIAEPIVRIREAYRARGKELRVDLSQMGEEKLETLLQALK